MKRALSVAAAALLVAAGGLVTATGASASTEHCEGYRTAVKVEVPPGQTGTTQTVLVGGVAVTVVVTGDDVSFVGADGMPVYGTFCVKAGTGQSGLQSGDSGTSGSYYGPGKDISYVVVYTTGPRPS